MNPHESRLDSAVSELRLLTADLPGAEAAIVGLIKASALYAAHSAKDILAEEIATLKSIISLQEPIMNAWKKL
jgi:hypothetical protein